MSEGKQTLIATFLFLGVLGLGLFLWHYVTVVACADYIPERGRSCAPGHYLDTDHSNTWVPVCRCSH